MEGWSGGREGGRVEGKTRYMLKSLTTPSWNAGSLNT